MALLDFLRTPKTTFAGEVCSPDYPTQPEGHYTRGSEVLIALNTLPLKRITIIGREFDDFYFEGFRQWKNGPAKINNLILPPNLDLSQRLATAYVFPLENNKVDLVIPPQDQKTYTKEARADSLEWRFRTTINNLPKPGERVAFIQPPTSSRGYESRRNTFLFDITEVKVDSDFSNPENKPIFAYVSVNDYLKATIHIADQEHLPDIADAYAAAKYIHGRLMRRGSCGWAGCRIPTLEEIESKRNQKKELIPTQ